ncbi:MFS transporter [Clostridium fallax]|uniref:Major Facilitator Superfamily protein n=1 Tax=Clostridium fallax TaxID=1533 RepID=A0A1M4SMP0_9CLOT|nr:MFS transporter [Clostridium fallax]SHE33456.1 Major Facilitator Superfamily protein [Clostridium fallax]SQB07895.1 Major Facilitator Superfamily [Clostridium fallax]
MEALLSSLAISGISGCDSAIIYSSIDEKESDKVFGIYGFCGTLGFLVAALTGSIIVKISIDLLAFITIFPYTLAFLLAMFLRDVKNHKSKKDGNNKKENLKDTFKIVLKDKNILLFIVAIGILNETTHSICVFLNQPLYIKNGVSLKWFGILTAFMQVATFISLKSYKIKMIIGVKNLYKISIFIIILCNLILIVSGEAYLTILIIFLIEGGYALTQPITETIKNKSIESLNRATILSIYSMIENIIASLINFIISIASKISMEWALITYLIFNILVFILIICYFYSKKKLTIVKENLI